METQPRPSTASNCLIIAFSSAIRDVPMAREMVIIDARASGMAATARATAKSSASAMAMSLYRLRAKTITQMIMMPMDSFLLKLSMVI